MELNEQQKNFLIELLSQEYESETRSETHRMIAFQILNKLQNNER